jgi:hypothetical protein
MLCSVRTENTRIPAGIGENEANPKTDTEGVSMRPVLIGVLALSFVVQESARSQSQSRGDEKPSARQAVQALQKELRYAPRDTTVVLSVSVEDLLNSKFFAGLAAREKKEITEDIGTGLGISLANVSRATLLASEEGSLWVLRTRTDLDGDQVLAQRLKGERARANSTFSNVPLNSAVSGVGQGVGKTSPPVNLKKDDREQWKSTSVGKHKVYEKDLALGGRPFLHEAFCVAEPRVLLFYSVFGKDAGQSLLRRVLGSHQELPVSLNAALRSSPGLKTIHVAVCIRDNPKVQGDLKRLVGGLDWVVLEAAIDAESVFLGRGRLACTAGESPAGLRKRIEGLLATALTSQRTRDPRDALLARLLVKELRRSLRLTEEGKSLVADFRVEAEELYLLICSLGTTAQSTFQKVGKEVKSSSGGGRK